jgi:hypothetical protein
MKRLVLLLVALIPAAAFAQVATVVGPRDAASSPGAPAAPGADLGPDADPALPAVCLAMTSPSPLQAAVQLAAPVNRAIAAGPRMQRLKTLTFDRRPGAVLKAWAPQSKAPADPSDPPKPKKKPEEEKLDQELEAFQRAVALGQWPAVRAYLRSLAPIEAAAGYTQMLRSLSAAPVDPSVMMLQQRGVQIPPAVVERHVFHTDDLIGLAGCAPGALSKEHVRLLGAMLRQALADGVVIEHVVARLQAEAARPPAQAILTRRQAARLLAEAGQLIAVGKFLPEPDEALKDKDLEALNLLARHYLERHAQDKKSPFLDKAWEATLAILALDGPRDEKEQAVRRAVELAPRVKEELGQAWLDQSYTRFPDRGMDILATLGSMVARGIQSSPHDTAFRLQGLLLQKTAVEALLKAAPARADEWSPTLTLLAANWLKEADYSRQYDRTTGYGARMRRDYYGNFYFFNPDDDAQQQQTMMMRQQGLPLAVTTPDVLRGAPSDAWLKRVDAGVAPKIAYVLAQLYLKLADEEKAFPHVEALAATHPDQAKELIKEFLRVWTRNHDPNADKNMYRNSYIYFFGFEQRAESIPLTRSKQERNLLELGGWVRRIRALKLGDVDEDMLAKAFTACHSSAEVYRTEAIEQVFGPLGQLQPKTLASLAQTMRGNLASIWRTPAEQEKKKTKRKQKDIEAEVRRGYEVALATVENGLGKFPDHWALLCAKAALLHDQATYEQDLAKSSGFSGRRAQAFALFQKSAERYRALVATRALPEDEETTQVYDLWFYASLGAVDLNQITEERQPDWKQPALIRRAIAGLPGEAVKRHMDKFANALFTRLSSAKPQIKFRYLKGGFEVVDADHKLAAEARKVYDYYKDLVTEIKLDAAVDGPTAVGHGQPFGLFVNLRHTRDIERESGGFGRYLQNQNSLSFSYNYGRPTADYRERFETAAKEALKEQFEVVSVTFQSENVHSRAYQDYGWRVTPYAYILLKPRGPQVDKVPPLRIDLDFLDTSGYVVIPIESPAVPIDCTTARPEPRPLRNLQVVQTLDERQADKGKLLLEIKALGTGLVGPLDELLAVDVPGFEVVKTDDNGVLVSKFDEDSESIAVVSERNWTVALQARDGLAQLPKQFHFASAKVPVQETTYQRYVDADVQKVDQVVSLERDYGRRGWGWQLWAAVGGVGFLILAAAAGYVLFRRGRRSRHRVTLPANLTPFTVIDLLTRARGSARLTDAQRAESARVLAELEAHYFGSEPNGHAPNLRTVAEQWLFAIQDGATPQNASRISRP